LGVAGAVARDAELLVLQLKDGALVHQRSTDPWRNRTSHVVRVVRVVEAEMVGVPTPGIPVSIPTPPIS